MKVFKYGCNIMLNLESRSDLREIVSSERKVASMFSKKTSYQIVSRGRTRSALIKLFHKSLMCKFIGG